MKTTMTLHRVKPSPNRRFEVISAAFFASLVLHALMILPFTRGGSSMFLSTAYAETSAVSEGGASDEQVMTWIRIDNTTMPEPEQKLPAVPLQDLEPESEAAANFEPKLELPLQILGESVFQGDATAPSIPPTEVVASLPYGEKGDRVGEIVSAANVVQSCRLSHPAELQQHDHEIDVALRVFVLPDGRIAQGAIAVSSGNPEFDRVVFQCVQAFANVNPLVVDSNPVGSWQTISTRW